VRAMHTHQLFLKLYLLNIIYNNAPKQP
jgi:hypothetical protein